MKMRKLIIGFVIIGMVALVSCKMKNRYGIAGSERVKIVTIAEILDNPGKYRDEECAVRGYVTQVLDVPGIKLDVFKIFDGTNEIWVYTNKGAPPLNIKSIVIGTTRELLNISFVIPIVKIPIIPEMEYFIMLKEFKFD
jgi:hypothetical protein